MADYWRQVREWRVEREAYLVLGTQSAPPKAIWDCPGWPCHHIPNAHDIMEMIRNCRDGQMPLQITTQPTASYGDDYLSLGTMSAAGSKEKALSPGAKQGRGSKDIAAADQCQFYTPRESQVRMPLAYMIENEQNMERLQKVLLAKQQLHPLSLN